MVIPQKEKASVSGLVSEVHTLVECGKLGEALEAIQCFVGRVTSNERSVANIFASADIDGLCQYIGGVAANHAGVDIPCPKTKQGTVILATELVKAGGHVEIIKDIIRLKLFNAPLSILLTDSVCKAELDVIADFSKKYSLPVEFGSGRSSSEKLEWLLKRLWNLAPTTLVLLTYNQDSIGIAAAHSHIADKVVFIHHGDHHLALGVTCEDFIHVDPHNIGFFHCKEALGIKNNYYWPLTVNCELVAPKSTHFLVDACIVTCSSGRAEKFDADNYLYDYFLVIPKLLASTGGRHIHIGNLTADMEKKLQRGLSEACVDPERFIYIPWVPSVAKALIEHKVDLYISSFPIGGGKATIEAMAAGIPLLMHQSYRSRFHGGADLAYPNAWIWRNESELIEIVSKINAADLQHHSVLARVHYSKFHTERTLIEATDFSKNQQIDIIPKLREYTDDGLQRFLDEMTASNSTWSELISTQNELQNYRALAEELTHQITLLRHSQDFAQTQPANPEQCNTSLRSLTSWRVTALMRKAINGIRALVRIWR